MPISKEITVAGKPVTVRELTVGEIRDYMKAMAEQLAEGDVVSLALMKDAPTLADIPRMSTMTPADIDVLAPSEIAEVAAACREVNPDFFGMLDRLAAAGATLQVMRSES